MTPFESAVRGSLEGSRGGRTHVHCRDDHGDRATPLSGTQLATIDVTDENFQEVTGRDGIVILDFWATWCGACRAFAPVYEAASEEHPDIVFGKVDTEAAAQLSSEIGIRALPTVAVYRDSIRVFFQAGALPKPALADLIAQVRGLDMEQVRAELDNHQHEPGHVHA